ncbi:hypothetical protein EMIHUDRAFT_236916 [Emiliania huxleyi CCMP1516]|uniref:Uncharacterized protein n=2 Tax=Emiliania huxleyi TaxID=2903 RepID=A0A0D3JRT3_EMIH1|nr:hypothetical protein EMIHUDRAFT_236916 [Emiliania huxleyi CCMP1516]EOD26218.1 hypothetical protein EMIHUDRAFT_236916 [Emiliania huxleyi CCMP1516]|eukprot:XP_005778647.1 hypothetical protein EMIHUDRAFT_236916 [Emiliania huxleyi CCMP1516]
MGRRRDADGSVQTWPGAGGGGTGGRSRRCCFATPTAALEAAVEFSLRDGRLSATDHAGQTHARV